MTPDDLYIVYVAWTLLLIFAGFLICKDNCKDKMMVLITVILAIIGIFQWTAIEKTDQTSRLRDRAFVYFLIPTIKPWPEPPAKVTDWGVLIKINNAGNMPARNLSIRYALVQTDKAKKIIDPWPDAKFTPVNVTDSIGPKQSFSLVAEPGIKIKEVEACKKSEIDIFLLMEVKYIDGFDLKDFRYTQMSLQLRIDEGGTHGQYFAGPHNCTDDQCPDIEKVTN